MKALLLRSELERKEKRRVERACMQCEELVNHVVLYKVRVTVVSPIHGEWITGNRRGWKKTFSTSSLQRIPANLESEKDLRRDSHSSRMHIGMERDSVTHDGSFFVGSSSSIRNYP